MTLLLDWLRWLLIVLLAYVGLMKEEQEGLWENRLELWLKRVYAHQESSFAKVTALARAVASLVRGLTERVFGTRLFSLRFLGVSIFYGLASLNLTVLVSPFVPHRTQSLQMTPLPGAGTRPDFFQHLVWFVLFLVLGSAPALLASIGQMSRWVWLIWIAFFVRWMFPLIGVATVVDHLWGHRSTARFGLGLLVLVGVSFLLDMLFVATTRWILAMAANARKPWNVLLAIVLDAGLGYAVIVGPVWLGVEFFVRSNRSTMSFALMLVFALKSLDFVIALLVFVFLLLIVIHAILWFILERPVYACLRFKLIRDKKFVRGAILALLTLPKLGTVWALFIALLKAF